MVGCCPVPGDKNLYLSRVRNLFEYFHLNRETHTPPWHHKSVSVLEWEGTLVRLIISISSWGLLGVRWREMKYQLNLSPCSYLICLEDTRCRLVARQSGPIVWPGTTLSPVCWEPGPPGGHLRIFKISNCLQLANGAGGLSFIIHCLSLSLIRQNTILQFHFPPNTERWFIIS